MALKYRESSDEGPNYIKCIRIETENYKVLEDRVLLDKCCLLGRFDGI